MLIKTCNELLAEFQEKEMIQGNPEKIHFEGVEGKDIYNITAPFQLENEIYIAARVEPRDSEHSEVHFFKKRNTVWEKIEAPTFQLQDPFFTWIDGEFVLGGVEIFPHPENPENLSWRTVFYKGKTLSSLSLFFRGPDGMKDLRLVELPTKEIGVFTRPQGKKGGRGKIGYTAVPHLSDLSIEVIEEAPLLDGQFTDDEWGGANEVTVLSDGTLGVLGHIACFDNEGNRHYYPMAFTLDPVTRTHTVIELLTTRSHFLPGESKRPDLIDVVFSGGIVRNGDGTVELYAGISDCEAQKITVVDPWGQVPCPRKK